MTPISAESVDEVQTRAEITLFRRVAIGAGVGALICSGIWVLIAVLAVALSGTDVALGPMLLVGLGCGVLAGLFLGGSAGALAGSRALEEAEHETLRR